MSVATDALAAADIATSAAAAASLWLAARRRAGRIRLGYLCFADAAALWCLGVTIQLALGAPLRGVAVGLTFADLPPLLALPAAVVGVAALMAGHAARAGDRWRTLGQRAATGPVVPRLVDGYIAAAALFVVGWITMFGPEYVTSGSGPGSFAVELIRPLAGLAAIGLLLPMAADVGWQAVPPLIAVLLVAVSDALGVNARLNGSGPGPAQQAVLIAAFCTLGLTPWLAHRRAGTADGPARGLPATATAAAVVAGAAALVVCGWALRGGHGAPALVVVASVTVLALAARVIVLMSAARAAARPARVPGQRFRELADLTSDVVLVCEPDGTVMYASPAVAEYGYPPDRLLGTRIDELTHPEDRPGSQQAVRAALARPADGPGRFPCRVRAADGTWRHVEATASRYRDPSGAQQLLITARDVSDQVALRRQLTHLTFHDGLTGLPNRAYLEERAAAVLAGPGRPAGHGTAHAGAIFIDLDGFTAVNDSVGHHAGDLLIAQAARRLRAVAPAHDTVVRWGGDEFAILAEDAATAQDVVEMAERLERCVAAEPFQVAGRDISLTASVGVAFAGSDPPGFVLRNADVAMARAKASGGGRVEVFAAQMHADVVHRLELTSDLQRAITDGQLVLEYQPVMDLATSQISGAEALVRWWRGGTAVPPGDFLDVAEESGLIVPLGDWVLRQACAQAASWCRSAGAIGVSVNFSPRQVSAERFPESVLAALADAGLPAHALTLEVTERVLVEASSQVVDNLSRLREAGVRLAIDDFGTGYASLAYLRRLPVDIIKIDPSFVAGLGQDETLTLLTRTIIQLGRDLGLSVVAEGIESSLQLGMLRDMGCGLGQGYLVAAPMPAAQMESLITPVTGQTDGGSAPPDAGPAPAGTGQAAPDAGAGQVPPDAAAGADTEAVVSLSRAAAPWARAISASETKAHRI
jgi:diguanylate cyclase (GGDEF)-like protein/PAS domain S-box-containing protein